MPTLANVLTMAPGITERGFMQAFVDVLGNNPNLLECTEQSLFNCASTAALLRAMPGNVLGQFYMLPFNVRGIGKVATPVIGYKHYNTLAAVSGIGVEASAVRKYDVFKAIKGTTVSIHHEQDLERSDAQIIGAYSVLVRGNTRYSPVTMGIKQLMQVKAKSMGARKSDSPWNDHAGPGFEAMCEKTVRRRQARSIPVNAFVMADAIETQADIGNPAWMIPDDNRKEGAIVTVEGQRMEITPPQDNQDSPIPTDIEIIAVVGKDKKQECKDIDEWYGVMSAMIKRTGPSYMDQVAKANAEEFLKLSEAGFQEQVQRIQDLINARASE